MVKKIFFLIFFFLCVFVVSDNSLALQCFNIKTHFTSKDSLGLDQPSDLAVGPNRDIYIVDGLNNRIVVLDSDGRLNFTFGKEGSGRGEFKYPLGIDISPGGKVFIADTGNHRVQVFDSRGGFLDMFTVKNSPHEKPSDPVDVLVSTTINYLYVSDNDNHK
ncbi:MAG: hypothetical protein HY806_00555, partial [Nitrospirae bacterium]|nr:hypothetical protein [Nitrospirota bacterium]